MPFFWSASFSPLAHRRVVALSCATGLMWAFSGAVSPAGAAGWDVCAHGCRYDQVGPALAASRDGDTIRIAPGVYTGGLTITTSVTLVGSGRDATIIRGGGPVVTIGAFGAAAQPTVALRGLTFTGGVSRTSPQSIPFTGEAGVFAAGGGVEIPPGADPGPGKPFEPGATVRITDSAITWNRVAPTATVPFGPPCPTGPCPAAIAAGGGIDSWGDLTLVRTSVSHNRVGTAAGLSAVASDAEGGAIRHHAGDLTIKDSTLADNQVSASAPNGRFADGGAILASGHTVTMIRDVVDGNSAALDAGLPDGIDMLAIAGGVHLAGGITAATVRGSKISHSSARMTNTAGYTTAFSGGLHADLPVTLIDDDISHNSILSVTLPGSPGNAQGDSGAGELSGSITGTHLTGNTVAVRSAAGDVTIGGGATIFWGTMTNSLVSNNRLFGSSPHGAVTLVGAGFQAERGVTLQDTDVTGNTGVATGKTGTVHGGGIYNSPVPNGPEGGPLHLVGSHISHNTLRGGPGITASGGGVFTAYPVDLVASVIVRNSPDQCVGC